MTSTTRVNFVLCWHMHQPWYQRGLDGEYQLPWVYPVSYTHLTLPTMQ